MLAIFGARPHAFRTTSSNCSAVKGFCKSVVLDGMGFTAMPEMNVRRKIDVMSGTRQYGARLGYLILASRSQGPSFPYRMLLFGKGN